MTGEVVVCKKRITPTLCREGILDTYGSGYMGLGYGHCLLRRRWAGIGSQPAYIFHSHGNGPPRPSLAPRGGNVPGHGSSRGNFLPGDDANTRRVPREDLWPDCNPRPQMDGACSHQTDVLPTIFLPQGAARTLRRTGYIENLDWSNQLAANVLCQTPQTLGLPVMFVSERTIFSGHQSCVWRSIIGRLSSEYEKPKGDPSDDCPYTEISLLSGDDAGG